MSDLPPLDQLPEAMPARQRSIQLVWIIPLVAAILGIWLAVRTIMQTGPTVSITFLTAEGLEAGKTKIRYKDVDIGEVKTIAISPEHSKIVLTAQFTKDAEDFLAKDSRFWVVRPRISGGQVSGVSTLLSGAYIAVDPGESTESARHFKGLEVAPILTDKLPGRQFTLEAQDMGSLDIGSPVYFRHIRVGEVIAHELDPNGRDVHIRFFIHTPYDQYVTEASRFWNASGFDVTLDSSGLKLQTQSLTSILSGGVAFETPPDLLNSERAAPGFKFTLHRDRAIAMKTLNGEPEIFEVYFSDSLRGLSPGAPVEFRGIPIGEVLSVEVTFNEKSHWFDFPVRLAIYREQLETRRQDNRPRMSEPERNKLLGAMIARGLRAQLRSGNLLTGQLFVSLDFFPETPKYAMDWQRRPLQLPTVPGTVEELQQSVAKLMRRIDKIPLEEIGANTRDTLAHFNASAQSLDKLLKRFEGEVTPASTAALAELRKTLAELRKSVGKDSTLQQDLRNTLRETTRAVQTVRSLADTLDREPEALIRGKTED